MNLKQNFLSLGKKARSGKKFQATPSLIVVHWTGPYPKQGADAVRNWWENGTDKTGVQASAHFVIKEDQVLQCLPIGEIGYHSGDQRNNIAIGIEVISMNNEGEFSEVTIETLRELIDHIRKQFSGSDFAIVRHYDGTQKKNCPNYYCPNAQIYNSSTDKYEGSIPGGDERWQELLTKIQ